MSVVLDYADIQGNVLKAYGKMGYPTGRNMLFHIDPSPAPVDPHTPRDATRAGRRFLMDILPLVTTAQRWTKPGEQPVVPRPEVAVNVAFTFAGLDALGIPTRTLAQFPDEFIDGMVKRAPILGDDFHTSVLTKSPPPDSV